MVRFHQFMFYICATIWLCMALDLCPAVEASGTTAMPAPRLLCPRDGMAMTDVASFFRWTPIKECKDYEIQIARDRDFKNLFKSKRTRNVRYHEDCYFPRDILPAGAYWWRVRAIMDGREGPWSTPFSLKVNADHPIAKDVMRAITPEKPLFMMRASGFDPRVHGAAVSEIIPGDLARIIVPDDMKIWDCGDEAIERARHYEALGIDFVVWNNRAQAPLSLLEYLFQNFRHCIGTAEGEHFYSWGWEKGPEGNISEWDYIRRAWILCAKYGRHYFLADGEYGDYKWTTISQAYREEFARYRRNIIPMFKSTIGNVALHSLGATQGLMAAGWVENCGFWADEWIWYEGGFGKLGQIGKPKEFEHGTRQCPWSYDIQMWLMGIASGSTAFHLESAHQWTREGKGAENYRRFFLPFIKAVIAHDIIPSRQAYLDSIKVAVTCDAARAKKKHNGRYDGDFTFLNELYALKHTPFQEIIPDNSRYGILCLLPPGAKCMNPQTLVVPQADLLAPGKAADVFNRAYPQRFHGEAFMWECDGTVIVTNSNENLDIAQHYQIALERGPVRELSGGIGVHQYLLGKVGKDGRSFWFQTNGEYPERVLSLELACAAEPRVKVTPAQARVEGNWDKEGMVYRLTLSIKGGPAECEIQ